MRKGREGRLSASISQSVTPSDFCLNLFTMKSELLGNRPTMAVQTLAICAFLFGFILLIQKFKTRNRLPLPPGPPGLPLIGNLFDMPVGKPWETFKLWGDKWGESCDFF